MRIGSVITENKSCDVVKEGRGSRDIRTSILEIITSMLRIYIMECEGERV